MRFMFGQALAGAARRGSQRLQELEQRANTITDKATERFMNQHEKWQSQYDLDKREYTKAYQKLDGFDFLSNAQKEMILLGGPDGAEKFVKALENDKSNQAYSYAKAKSQTVSYEDGRAVPLENPKCKYTDEMRQSFLGKVFQRSDDYDKLVGQGDEKGLADLGLGIKKASALYAQGLNPYRDIEETLNMTTQTAEQKNQSMLGLTIPASYLQSGVKDQLATLGIVKPEEITDAQLGKDTGWKTPVYDLIDTETLLRIEESALNQDKVALSMKATIQEMNFNKEYNGILMKTKLKEYQGLDAEQLRVKLQNDNLKLQNAYDKIKLDPVTATTIQKLELEAGKLQNDLMKKNLSETSLNQSITNAHAREIQLKEKLKATTDPEGQLVLSTQIKQVQDVIKSHLIMKETINAVGSGINNASPLFNLKEQFISEAKNQRGYFEESIKEGKGALAAIDTGEEVGTGRIRKAYTTERGIIYQDENKELFDAIEAQVQADVDFKFLNMLAKPNAEGVYVSNMPDDRGINAFISTLSVTNKNDYELSVIQRITDTEFVTIVDAVTDGVMQIDQIIKEVAETNKLPIDEASKIVNNIVVMNKSSDDDNETSTENANSEENTEVDTDEKEEKYNIKYTNTAKRNQVAKFKTDIGEDSRTKIIDFYNSITDDNYNAYADNVNRPMSKDRYKDLQLARELGLYSKISGINQGKLKAVKTELGI